ncbi:SET and MYND domain containing protein [Planoprotostelium fungivorum]|uniref:SET and MYND domain containing protein n=1 Tax=Planoprotostelium fungivorum TaxID=1890364 RepID=A0A2P6MTR5_9EUKA|nr:SET and MYND domain containing protein [Planoprotostelium fungivorum]
MSIRQPSRAPQYSQYNSNMIMNSQMTPQSPPAFKRKETASHNGQNVVSYRLMRVDEDSKIEHNWVLPVCVQTFDLNSLWTFAFDAAITPENIINGNKIVPNRIEIYGRILVRVENKDDPNRLQFSIIDDSSEEALMVQMWAGRDEPKLNSGSTRRLYGKIARNETDESIYLRCLVMNEPRHEEVVEGRRRAEQTKARLGLRKICHQKWSLSCLVQAECLAGGDRLQRKTTMPEEHAQTTVNTSDKTIEDVVNDMQNLQLSAPCERRPDPIKGRLMKTKRYVAAGEPLLQGVPYAVIVYPRHRYTACNTCLRTFRTDQEARTRSKQNDESGASTCRICKETTWCSEACRNSQDLSTFHWPTECAAFKKLYGSKVGLDHDGIGELKLLIRILCRRAAELKCQLDELRGRDVTWQHVSELVANYESIERQEPERMKDFHDIYDQLVKLVPAEVIEGLEKRDILDVSCIIACNAFGIWNKKLEQAKGLSLYPNVSFFNHSCAPNCVRYQDGKSLIIRAIHDIEPDTELCISYIELEDTKESRSILLRRHYYFDCNCTRCSDETEETDERVLATLCPVSKCAGILGVIDPSQPQVRTCNGCAHVVTKK